MAPWTFVTNHTAVLVLIAERGQISGGEIAQTLGITERSVRRIIEDLVGTGYVLKRRVGRSNHYLVNSEMPLRRADWHHVVVRDLLKLWLAPREPEGRPTDGPGGGALLSQGAPKG